MSLSKTIILIFVCLFCHALWAQDTSLIATVADTANSQVDTMSAAAEIRPDNINERTFLERVLDNKFLPFFIVIFLGLILLYFPIKLISNSLTNIQNKIGVSSEVDHAAMYDQNEKRKTYTATKRVIEILIPITLLGFLLHVAVVDTQMEGYVKEWLNLLVRWAHVVAGIMWIGASFYFIFLENNLNRTKNIRDELAGNLWAVHGGGFYFLEKYKVAPKQIPEDLHWFKYEAYFTFITGFALLVIVYYLNATGFLIDPSVYDMSVGTAIGLSIFSIASGWIIYDLLCRSSLIRHQTMFIMIGLFLLTVYAYFLTQIFNPRAAYLHFGAIIGAIMVGNVFFNIIPAQKAMVRAAVLGLPLDSSLGVKAGQRSLHNNYFTLPVIFIMISNHFPSTFGHPNNWIILMVISLASAGIKHYWNLLDRGIVRTKILIISLLTLIILAYVISPAFEEKMDLAIPVTFEEANAVIQTRCISCHSANPTDDEWTKAPNGVMYDTPQEIKNKVDKIMTRAVRSKNMPLGNKTKMTEEERTILKRWIIQGAVIE
jgi:uncharacterized membrane protein